MPSRYLATAGAAGWHDGQEREVGPWAEGLVATQGALQVLTGAGVIFRGMPLRGAKETGPHQKLELLTWQNQAAVISCPER